VVHWMCNSHHSVGGTGKKKFPEIYLIVADVVVDIGTKLVRNIILDCYRYTNLLGNRDTIKSIALIQCYAGIQDNKWDCLCSF
jgi:hypothetical protein